MERGTFARDNFVLSPPSESKLLDTYLTIRSAIKHLIPSNNYGALTVAFMPSQSPGIGSNLSSFNQRNLGLTLKTVLESGHYFPKTKIKSM